MDKTLTSPIAKYAPIIFGVLSLITLFGPWILGSVAALLAVISASFVYKQHPRYAIAGFVLAAVFGFLAISVILFFIFTSDNNQI